MMKSFCKDALNFFFPRYCWICGDRLSVNEDHLCASCIARLPRTHYHLRPDNPMEQLFWGSIPIERAAAFFFYHQQTASSEILYILKYSGNQSIGEYMGEIYAREILADEGRGTPSFFKGIDAIVPLPLNEKKRKIRGYNQCDVICKGLHQVTGIPVLYDVVIRTVANSTQTRKGRVERGLNVEHIFQLTSRADILKELEGKHILLVDDVCTTGATLRSFAETFLAIPNIRISIITLGLASSVF